MKILKVLNILFICSTCAHSASYEKSYELGLAKSGNIDAQYNVAMNFLNGEEGFPKDANVAKEWLEKAAKKGRCPFPKWFRYYVLERNWWREKLK